MTSTHDSEHGYAAANIARLVLAEHNNDGREVLADIAEISAAIGPVALITRLLQLINSQGRATYGSDWPRTLTDTINSFDIDALGSPEPTRLEHMNPDIFTDTFDPDD